MLTAKATLHHCRWEKPSWAMCYANLANQWHTHPCIRMSEICTCIHWYLFISNTGFSSRRRKRLRCHHTLAISLSCSRYTPHTIKTDNGPAYISQKTRHFLQLWHVSHHAGISCLATGQAIMEKEHEALQNIYLINKREECVVNLHRAE